MAITSRITTAKPALETPNHSLLLSCSIRRLYFDQCLFFLPRYALERDNISNLVIHVQEVQPLWREPIVTILMDYQFFLNHELETLMKLRVREIRFEHDVCFQGSFHRRLKNLGYDIDSTSVLHAPQAPSTCCLAALFLALFPSALLSVVTPLSLFVVVLNLGTPCILDKVIGTST